MKDVMWQGLPRGSKCIPVFTNYSQIATLSPLV
jgi:hypothetical protein